ncbi:MAG: zinc ribbon domain-containing protein [Dehalococcoidia bacterium]|nr:MAG: zinc ribbon domain-containing protein [Dehalococcoidia bacterium]
MPIYQYKCEKCGYEFDLRRSLSEDDSEITCPQCGDLHPRRVFSTFSTSSSGGCAPVGGG